MAAYLKRLLDSTDESADLMMLGIFCGFMGFVAAIFLFLALYGIHAFWPARVSLDASGFAGSMAGLGGMYASVLGATTAAYHWRK